MTEVPSASSAAAPPIVVISLARTPGRLAGFRAANDRLGAYEVFDAVDGQTVDPAMRAALGDTSLYTPGGVGAALSHVTLWRRCAAGETPLTICEDDAILRRDFRTAAARVLQQAPDFDVVLWGWNFDAVLEVRVTPHASAAVMADQAAMRRDLAAFQDETRTPVALPVVKALGTPCYTVSPRGARELLARCLPLKALALQLPLMGHPLSNISLDLAAAAAYGVLRAHVAMPPLALTPNDWRMSTIRNAAEPLPPDQALAHAAAAQARGRTDEATATLQVAAAATPGSAPVLTQLGVLLAGEGHAVAASAALERAVALDPELPAAGYNLARLRLVEGRFAEALDLLETVLRHAPGDALAQSNRGVALLGLDRAAEAEDAFRRALSLAANLVEAHRGLATALAARDALEAAGEALERGLVQVPGDAAMAGDLARVREQRARQLVSLAHAREREGQFEAARDAALAALRLQPDMASAHNNLGVAWLRLAQPEAAEAAFRSALAGAPDYAEAHHGLAFALLKQARFAEAWPEHDWRLRSAEARAWTSHYPKPLWTGEVRADATLMLVAEQGFGDTLMASRLIPLIAGRVGRVVLQVPPALSALLTGLPGVDAVAATDHPYPEHDLWLPLMSLPGRLGVGPDFRPGTLATLAADAAKAACWAGRLPPAGLRIGLAWQGNPTARVEHGRSIPLAAFAPLAALPGVRLVSLQKGAGLEQAAGCGFELLDLGAAYRAGDFSDTAAVIANLDLVIACDTSVAHLAGAMDRPVWLALGDNPDWRWLSARDDSIWHPSARLFRRRRGEPWRAVIERMSEALAKTPPQPLLIRRPGTPVN